MIKHKILHLCSSVVKYRFEKFGHNWPVAESGIREVLDNLLLQTKVCI